jgi:hypothetical protein
MQIAGTIRAPGQSQVRLNGTETGSGAKSSISCASLSKLPRIGEGLVIPREDNRFIDLEDGEGELKVPAGISLRPQDE